MKNKKLFFDLLYFLLIIFSILFIFWLFFWLKSESALCLNEPLDYYMNKTGNICFCFKEFW
jgi:hypothetical protein